MEQAFYAAAAGVCFALLGLWWVVVGFRHEEWRADRRQLRLAYDISLYFLLPGTMSLLALLSSTTNALWRWSFAVAALIGAIDSVAAAVIAARRRGDDGGGWAFGRWILLASPVLYVVVAVVALLPRSGEDWGSLTPLEVEGILLSVLVFLGVNLVWAMWFAPPRRDAAP